MKFKKKIDVVAKTEAQIRQTEINREINRTGPQKKPVLVQFFSGFSIINMSNKLKKLKNSVEAMV